MTRRRTSWLLALALVCGMAAPTRGQDATIALGQRFQGVIADASDTDTVGFEEVEGSRLTITVKRTSGSKLSPTLELLDAATLTPFDLGSALKLTSKRATLRDFIAPFSGTYIVRVGAATAGVGGYRVAVKGIPKSKFVVTGAFSMPGAIVDVAFVARHDSTVTAKFGGAKSGTLKTQPTVLELEGPFGASIAVAGGFSTNAAAGSLKLGSIALPYTGAYALRLVGANGSTGAFSGVLKVKRAKPAKGIVHEPGTGPTAGAAFTLEEVRFGRGLPSLDGSSIQVVSPLTTVDLQPLTGLPLVDTVKPLYAQVDPVERLEFGLGPFFTPPIVPRNAVLELVFSAAIDVTSLALDIDGRLTSASPVQCTVGGSALSPRAHVKGNVLVLDPVVGDALGWPASPVLKNAVGVGVASNVGHAALTVDPVGLQALMAQGGASLQARPDLLGSTAAGGSAIGFNPGNAVLDFIGSGGLGPNLVRFNGFLPDLVAPRLTRKVGFDGTFQGVNGDMNGPQSLTLRTVVGFSNVAKQGRGQWADGVLRVRPDGPMPETALILSSMTTDIGGGSFQTTFHLASTLAMPLTDGEDYRLERIELWEPDPSHPLDPTTFDPLNPALVENMDVANFFELCDASGAVVHGNAIPSTGMIRVRFSEPMDVASFQPYESFWVSEDVLPSPLGQEELGRIVAEDGGRTLTFVPDRELQFGPATGTFERVGFGPFARPMLAHLRVVPPPDLLFQALGEAEYGDFVDEGIRGVSDVAGRAVAVPVALWSASTPYADLERAFEIVADPSLERHGAVVLRFRGTPQIVPGPGIAAAVSFRDISASSCGPEGNVFGQNVADFDLHTNGFLAGAPVGFIQKIHDDFNPSPQGPTLANSSGASTPIGGFAVLGGSRFQHVYRAEDCSPDSAALAGTILHLRQVHFAPFGGFVVNTTIPDFQVHGGHTRYIPITSQGGGIPLQPETGLNHVMGGTSNVVGFPETGLLAGNYNATNTETGLPYERQLLYGSETGPDAFIGSPFVIDQTNVFTPAGTSRPYHPLPHVPFDHLLPYDNGAVEELTPPNGSGTSGSHSLLLEYRVRASIPGATAVGNAFTFAVGMLTSARPRFRVFTIGAGCGSCVFQNTCFAGLTSAVSPPLDPDKIRNAAGPSPAAPSLACDCPRNPATGNVVPPGAPAGCALVGSGMSIVTLATTLNSVFAADQHNYGDNARYFMVFDYVKKDSLVRTPWIRVQPNDVSDVTWLAPIFDPPLTPSPEGTALSVRLRTSTDGVSPSATPWLDAEAMVDEDNPLNAGSGRVFVQFEVRTTGNPTTQVVPALDTVVLPFRR